MNRPATIAILGGGQLGLLLGEAAKDLGDRVRFLDPAPDPPAAAIGQCLRAPFDDHRALDALLTDVDVVTYEWEGVPASVADYVTDHRPLAPNAHALGVAQDRVLEKQQFDALGIPTARWMPVASRDDLDHAIATIGTPAILKTRTGGYDGKGQARITAPEDAAQAWDTIDAQPAILEALVPFIRECSVIAARAHDGTIATYPIGENTHRDGILRVTRVPAPGLEPERFAYAVQMITELLTALDYVGVLALECFETADGLLANEFAPRVHNSGHWTIEGAATSQFAQHLRAITGRSLGSTAITEPSAMVNCIGRLPDANAIAAIPGAHLHAYGKAPRRGRKLGHVTVTAPDAATRDARLAAVLAVVDDDG